MHGFNLHDYKEKGEALKNISPSECVQFVNIIFVLQIFLTNFLINVVKRIPKEHKTEKLANLNFLESRR